MKKHSLKKLNLSRETIQPLEGKTLEGVAGGATPAVIISSAVGLSLFFCRPQQAR
jgi:hypothetical protein